MKKLIISAAAFMSLLSAFTVGGDIFRPVTANAAVSAVWPLDEEYNNITTYFDPDRNYNDYLGAHNAIDIAADYGADIYAAYNGVCISAGWMDAYGYLIILYHEDLDIYTFYAHCSSMAVYEGEQVNAGAVIGYVGSTGIASGNHLHFGVCDSLMNGWPTITYYDPLTYFSYDTDKFHETVNCDCTEDYAGIYVTKDIDTYLNIRNGHGVDFAIVGKVYPNVEIRVTKADGSWAHVEYNGVTGCCSMEFLQKVSDLTSGMTISDATYPQGELSVGKAFGIEGKINSRLRITRVTGGIYSTDGTTGIYTAEENPDSTYYNISGTFDKQIRFDKLEEGSYVYKIEAEDESGNVYTLINTFFYVGGLNDGIAGDINGDNMITISDAVILQSYLLGENTLTAEQMILADMNRDSSVDVYDMVLMRKALIQN